MISSLVCLYKVFVLPHVFVSLFCVCSVFRPTSSLVSTGVSLWYVFGFCSLCFGPLVLVFHLALPKQSLLFVPQSSPHVCLHLGPHLVYQIVTGTFHHVHCSIDPMSLAELNLFPHVVLHWWVSHDEVSCEVNVPLWELSGSLKCFSICLVTVSLDVITYILGLEVVN